MQNAESQNADTRTRKMRTHKMRSPQNADWKKKSQKQ